ncbi:DMT family transporter [Mycoplasmatota bacterium]|nr:DMT family transporter [Mycoplasmatota bacterium]
MSNHVKGIIFILLSVLFFGLNTISNKMLVAIPTFERIFFMNIVALIFVSIQVKYTGESFKSKKLPLLSLRGILGFLSTLFYFYSIDKLQLNDATLLNKTSPFFVTFFSVLWLRERVNKIHILAIIIAVVGSVFVINPSFSFTIIPALVGVAGGATAGLAYTIVRKLRDYDSASTIVFYFTLISSIASLPFMLIEGFVMPIKLSQYLLLLSMGIFITLGQTCLSLAYKYEEASKISIYSFGQIVISLLFGILFFKEIPTLGSIVGGITIIVAGYLNYKGNLIQHELKK